MQEKQLMEDQKRQQEHADEMRREEDRRAQVIAREQEAAQDTFDNHEEEDTYDPYAMDFWVKCGQGDLVMVAAVVVVKACVVSGSMDLFVQKM